MTKHLYHPFSNNSFYVFTKTAFSNRRFQETLINLNPNLAIKPQEEIVRPDGDVNLTEEEVNAFELPKCPKCNETSLKPKIVFFGDSVPKDKVANCKSLYFYLHLLFNTRPYINYIDT